MMSAIGMTRHKIGRKRGFVGVSRILRAAGHCVVILLAVGLAGCEYLAEMGVGQTGSAGSAGTTTRSVQPDKTVRQAQTLLKELGYDPGPADGLLGNRTVQAIREYQKAAGLPVDGKVSARLMQSLKSGKHRKQQAKATPAAAPGSSNGAATAAKQPLPVKGIFSAEYGDIQPIYTLGDAFVWSSAHVDRVVRVGADNVVWRSTDGTGHTALRSFAVPPLEWQTESAEGSSKIGVDPLETWPLGAGAKIEFEVFNTSRDLGQETVSEAVETWRCSRSKDRTIDVPAGRFETIVVTCIRDPVPNGSWRKRVWYYAPAVRHYIRRDSFDAADRRLRIRLVSLRPAWKDWPPAARAGLDWAIQDTLTTGENGIGVEWGSSGVSTKLTIVPGMEFKAMGDRRCRKYALIQTQPMALRVYPAIACWDPEKAKWLVPGLDDSAAPVSAVR
jgi:peptidoglycan hydrolase-like protein with peptidoglycan-binding domain